jgi:hypothetical protein
MCLVKMEEMERMVVTATMDPRVVEVILDHKVYWEVVVYLDELV